MMRDRWIVLTLLMVCMQPLFMAAQSQDTIVKRTSIVGPAGSQIGDLNQVLNFKAFLQANYSLAERLFKEGKYYESRRRSKQYVKEYTRNESRLFATRFGPKFYELIALNEIALDNFSGADSAIRQLLREDINFVASEVANDHQFERMLSNYSIQPMFTIGLQVNRINPHFSNTKSVSLNEDYDYSQSLQSSKPSYGFGGFMCFNWKNICIVNESTWNNFKIQRSIVHNSGAYSSELNELSRFFITKTSFLGDIIFPFALKTQNKIHSKVSFGPSITYLRLRSSDGSITSSPPVYSFEPGNSSPAISPSGNTNTTRIDLSKNRCKNNWAVGLEAKLWFFMFNRYWMFSTSYQFAIRDYTSSKYSMGIDILFDTFYVDSPSRMRYLQMGLAYCKPLRPKVSSTIKYE